MGIETIETTFSEEFPYDAHWLMRLGVNGDDRFIQPLKQGTDIALEIRFDQLESEVTFGYDDNIFDEQPITLFGPYAYDGISNKGVGAYTFLSLAEDMYGGTGGEVTGVVKLWSLTESFDGLGDFNDDGTIDVVDIDLLTAAINDGPFDKRFDLDFDGRLSEADRRIWIEKIKRTFIGDSNLDGEFNSADFVTEFQASEYEDDLDANSTWADGDWNGDFEFNSRDLVYAFTDAHYEQGPRETVAVPEPAGLAVGVLLFLFAFEHRGRGGHSHFLGCCPQPIAWRFITDELVRRQLLPMFQTA
jgi:hypothetical protein